MNFKKSTSDIHIIIFTVPVEINKIGLIFTFIIDRAEYSRGIDPIDLKIFSILGNLLEN